jgi:hypothetical protein
MTTTTSKRTVWRERWTLRYHDVTGTPNDGVLTRTFRNEDEARAWADSHLVVPLGLEARDEKLAANGRVLAGLTTTYDF